MMDANNTYGIMCVDPVREIGKKIIFQHWSYISIFFVPIRYNWSNIAIFISASFLPLERMYICFFLFVCLSVYLSACLCIYLFIHVRVGLSVSSSAYLFICFSVYHSIYISIHHFFIIFI